MKYFIVDNPFVFIGYYIVLAKSMDEAVDKARIRACADYGIEPHPITWQAKEIIFDNDGIFDELSIIE